MGQKEKSEGFDSEEWKGLDLLLLSSKGGHEPGRVGALWKLRPNPPCWTVKKWGQSYNCLELNFANILNEAGNRFSPRVSRQEHSLADTLISSLGDSKQRTS